jgi:hypothetical protein
MIIYKTYIQLDGSYANPSTTKAKIGTDKYDTIINNFLMYIDKFDFNEWKLYDPKIAVNKVKDSINYKLGLIDEDFERAKCLCKTDIRYLFPVHNPNYDVFAFIGCNCIFHFDNKEISSAIFKNLHQTDIYCIMCGRKLSKWSDSFMHNSCKTYDEKFHGVKRNKILKRIDNIEDYNKKVLLKEQFDTINRFNYLKNLKINFGKHKGKTIENTDMNYLKWIISKSDFNNQLFRKYVIEYIDLLCNPIVLYAMENKS